MSLLVTKVKAQITIQDIGRWGFQSSGVPVSGPMDDLAFKNANLLVGNTLNTGCVEIGMGSVEMLVINSCLITLCGNGHQLSVNDIEVGNNKPILCNSGCTLKLKPSSRGIWSYLSIGGGFEIPNVLGSQSTYLNASFGGVSGRTLISGDELTNRSKYSSLTTSIIKSLSKTEKSFAQTSWSVKQLSQHRNKIRIFPGPEWDWISPVEQQKFVEQSYTVSVDSNRMGYRLQSIPIARQINDEMISSGVSRGTMQLTNDGSLIVLMADSQTVGGYPRIAQVSEVDIPWLAQAKPGTTLKFELISNVEAEALLLEREQDLRKLKVGIHFKML